MKRKFQHYKAGRTPNHTQKKMAKKRKSMDRLGYRKSIYQKENTLSYSYYKRGGRDTTAKTSIIGSWNKFQRGDITENRLNIQDVRSRVMNS